MFYAFGTVYEVSETKHRDEKAKTVKREVLYFIPSGNSKLTCYIFALPPRNKLQCQLRLIRMTKARLISLLQQLWLR